MKVTCNILLFLWQLPQNLLGLAVRAFFKYKSKSYEQYTYMGVCVAVASNMMGGISLGRYIIVRTKEDDMVNHEYGHTVQSKYLGWLYLPTVGLCSVIWTQIYRKVGKSYYWMWCEKWADRLGNVKRE